mmetsp:Transcript_43291/g.136777  ORF Transcript_43291/g.136777 Transcript_43291/m.136777 type:complete len:115 (+) Transcript_43291:351-695(+)
MVSLKLGCAQVLSRYGIPQDKFIGRTAGPGHLDGSAFDDKVYEDRSSEILAWLAEHPEVKSFVILDDRKSAGRGVLAPHFVHVNSASGLCEADVEGALMILKVPRDPNGHSLAP